LFIIFSIIADQFASFAQSTTNQIIDKISKNPQLFTFGVIANIISGVLFLFAAWSLYVLLKEINQNFSVLFLILNSAGVLLQCVSAVSLLTSKEILIDVTYHSLFSTEQLSYYSKLFIHIYQNGFMAAQIFFGLWLLPLGLTVLKSKIIPKIFGILLIIDSIAITFWFFQYFLFPKLIIITYLCVTISLIAEAGFTFYLLFNGIQQDSSMDDQKI